MSTTIQSESNLLKATAAAAAAASSAASKPHKPSSDSAPTPSALSSLTGNFNTFLTLLTTQLKNQDPSSPMDSDKFTSEIATFAGVQQQVDTNTNLGRLISLTQDSQASTATSLVGHKASFVGSQIPLQSGTGGITFQTPRSEPIAIAISNSAGAIVRTLQETSVAGANQWTWDGKDNSGNVLANDAYGIAVQTQDGSNNITAVPFTIDGTVTGITKAAGGGITVEFGTVNADLSTVNAFGASTP